MEDDIPVDIADEYDMGRDCMPVSKSTDAELGTIDFSLLELKPKHENKPLWVCPNFHIYLDTASRYYEQVVPYSSVSCRRPTF